MGVLSRSSVVSKIAYYLWESEGRPYPGNSLGNWYQAERMYEQASEDGARAVVVFVKDKKVTIYL